jgi:hypothetical protein
MPSASATTLATVKVGDRLSARIVYLKSRQQNPAGLSMHGLVVAAFQAGSALFIHVHVAEQVRRQFAIRIDSPEFLLE